MNFRMETTQFEEHGYVVALTGEVDLYTAPELRQELHRVIKEGASLVIVDLTDTTFIDSTTLGVLLSALKRLRPNEGKLVIVSSDRNIRKIFEITLLDRVFPIYETRAEALEQLAPAA